MRLTDQQINGLPVQTRSGQSLGRVTGFEVEVGTQKIMHYHIKTGLIKGLWHQQLVIASEQVVEITSVKMVVEDAAAKPGKSVLDRLKPTLVKNPAGKPAPPMSTRLAKGSK
tara:strand:- start:151 stop:486 length:336 start_codon:yes stop_codon:yes gene_type:complete